MSASLGRAVIAETIGSLLLAATVIGSGIMAQRLCDGNDGLALLANALATGCALYVLILAFAPVSGAHFNPAVSLMKALQRELSLRALGAYLPAQIAGALAGMLLAHAMFDLSLWQDAQRVRAGHAQWLSEAVATFGLLLTIFTIRETKTAAAAVALYIVAAYWFTASTSFANPALTVARSFSDSFAGIRPADAVFFIGAQLAMAGVCAVALPLLFGKRQ